MTDQMKTRVTIDDLMTDDWVEVIDGQLKEIDTTMMGFTHTLVIHNAYDLFKPFVQQNDLGYVHGDGLKYILYVDDNGIQTARTPDLAFLRKARVPNFDYEQPFEGAPDFAVEVASPGQTSGVLLDKVADFLNYGTEEVWLIYPMRREVYRYLHNENAPDVFRDTDTITSTLFPGLVIKVADLFAQPA
jgi:Uma2 family endonuclease